VKTDCPREHEVLEAVTTGSSPEDAALRSHVSACRTCSDAVTLLQTLASERDRLMDQALVPSAGLVWWRAQIRARQEAARTVAQPIAYAQGIAVVVGLVIAFAVAGLASPWVGERTAWLMDYVRAVEVSAQVTGLTSVLQGSTMWILAALAAWLIVAPVAILLAEE
jgi:hypothetical protein